MFKPNETIMPGHAKYQLSNCYLFISYFTVICLLVIYVLFYSLSLLSSITFAQQILFLFAEVVTKFAQARIA